MKAPVIEPVNVTFLQEIVHTKDGEFIRTFNDDIEVFSRSYLLGAAMFMDRIAVLFRNEHYSMMRELPNDL